MRAGAALPVVISGSWIRQGAERGLPENERVEGTARVFFGSLPVPLFVLRGTADLTSNSPGITARSIISMTMERTLRSASKGVEAKRRMTVINSVDDISGIVIVLEMIILYIY
jgi:hypothetical protein